MGNFVDSLFWRDAPVAAAPADGTAASMAGTDAGERASEKDAAEVSRIFMNVARSEPLPAEDIRHVGQIRRHALAGGFISPRVVMGTIDPANFSPAPMPVSFVGTAIGLAIVKLIRSDSAR